MADRILELIIDESKWLPLSMTVAFLAVAAHLYRSRTSELSTQRRTLAAMNLFFGLTLGTMAFGHLLAVTVKNSQGTLEGSVPLLYAIGISLAVPSWALVHHARGLFDSNETRGRITLILNAWLAATLLLLGPHNVPLAVPGFLNAGYQLHSNRIAGWAILSMAVIVNLGLFVGALFFLASGQTFEQFRGLE
jgi:hypothetical protein